jgi:hypothetical protein
MLGIINTSYGPLKKGLWSFDENPSSKDEVRKAGSETSLEDVQMTH